MDVGIFDMAAQAFFMIMAPERLAFLALGVLFGLALGVVPGLSGIVGLALLLPYTWDMDPFTALAFLMGLLSVVTTADTIPTVLFGVPGTVGSAATIMDGFPMAKKGEAGRAFGAAFSASVLGGPGGRLRAGRQHSHHAAGHSGDGDTRPTCLLYLRPVDRRHSGRRVAAQRVGRCLYRPDDRDRWRRSADRHAALDI